MEVVAMQGICINAGNSTTLEINEKYYLFEHGPNNYYVSRFNDKKSHFGSYQRNFFELIPDVVDEVDEGKELSIDGLHVAEITKRFKKYSFNIGDRYVIGPTQYKRNTHFKLYELETMRFRGVMPVDIFELIKPHDGIPEKRTETAQFEVLDDSSINTSNDKETSENELDSKPKVRIVSVTVKKQKPKEEKKKKPTAAEKLEDAGQLNIFDFLDD